MKIGTMTAAASINISHILYSNASMKDHSVIFECKHEEIHE